MKLTTLLLLTLLHASVAFAAATPEVCGNGVDDGASSGTKGSCPGGYMDAVVGDGCDLKCPTPDQDADGYTTTGTGTAGENKQDCDDTDRSIYPGVYTTKGCTGGEYRQCQDSGAFTSCTSATLCENPGHCFYIDGAASDTTGTGSFANPWATLQKVSGGCGGTGDPLSGGDFVYIKGTTNLTTTYNYNSRDQMLCSSQRGSAGAKITIKQYPGATAQLVPTTDNAKAIHLEGAAYFVIDGLIIKTAKGIPVSLVDVDNVEVKNTYLYDSSGSDADNNAAIYTRLSTYLNIHHNFIKDYVGYQCEGSVTPGTGTCQIIGAVLLMNQDVDPYRANALVKFNSIWWTPTDQIAASAGCKTADKCGSGVHLKHSQTYAHSGDSEIAYNFFVRPKSAVKSNSSGTYAHHNLIIEPQTFAFQFQATDEPNDAGIEKSRIEYNTLVGGHGVLGVENFDYNPTRTSEQSEELSLKYNIFADTMTHTTQTGTFRVDAYGTDEDLTTLETDQILISNENCFYTSSGSLQFNYFYETDAGQNLGGSYSFANWKGTEGYDLLSVEDDPEFDAYFRKGSGSTCGDWGWLVNVPGGDPPVTATALIRFRRGLLR